jgi:GNAT superfamily N-acetyltransferase
MRASSERRVERAAFHIRAIDRQDIDAARTLLCDNGWAHRIADADMFRRLIANSTRTAVAVANDGALVGFCRALCDQVSNGYLSMLVVAPEHRRKGVGSALVRFVTGDDPAITWMLRAARDADTSFFAKLGFAPSTVAMERPRRTSS